MIRDIDDIARGIDLGLIDPANPTKKKRSSLGQMLRERVETQKHRGGRP